MQIECFLKYEKDIFCLGCQPPSLLSLLDPLAIRDGKVWSNVHILID